MTNFRALLVSSNYVLAFSVVPLLKRAGFDIDLIAANGFEENFGGVSTISYRKGELASCAALAINKKNYDLIILSDDEAIGEILRSNLPCDVKTRLLPVVSIENRRHLFSKCGLSEILFSANISTPNFYTCMNKGELISGANQLGFPIFIKIDSSGGGAGVFECFSIEDVKYKSRNLSYPLLLQKKVNGKTLDLTAFYRNKKLIYFSYSVFCKTISGPYGPSSVRRFTQIGFLSKDIYEELQHLGTALGANGFVNITCIECSITNKRFYIEADMRPNIWIDKGKYIGLDPSVAISNFFLRGSVLIYPQAINQSYPLTRLIAHIDRLEIWEILINRYQSWENFSSTLGLISYCKNRLLLSNKKRYKIIFYKLDLKIRLFFSRFIKPLIPEIIWRIASSVYRKIFRIS